jgi:hypothetical protein
VPDHDSSRLPPEPLPPHGGEVALTWKQRGLLAEIQARSFQYFLEDQFPHGLVFDRRSNHGPAREGVWCSTAATGMGLIAVALAAAPPYHLLTPKAAIGEVGLAIETALEALPHDHGVMPHFLDVATGTIRGVDALSTVDSSWLVAGALWAAAFLGDAKLEALASRLYDRVDWRYWTAPDVADPKPLLRHGMGKDGRFLNYAWDRLNGETVFMYVLGAGAAEPLALSADSLAALQPFYGTVAGLRFNNADLPLYVFQYGLDLIDFERYRVPGPVDLHAEARIATVANHRACVEAASRFTTFRRFWGLSEGDGPGDPPNEYDYRAYAPEGLNDGTAHLTATLASVAHHPEGVFENLERAWDDRELGACGRYGLSNVNLDRHWVSRDMVGIDVGAAILALDNFLNGGRVRAVFQSLPCVKRGMDRLGFRPAPDALAR